MTAAMHGPRRRGRRDAFTLVEMLVAMGVLVLITVVIAQIVNQVSIAVGNSGKTMSQLSAGQSCLEQLSLDISRMVLRADVDYDFTKQAGNDRLSYYSRTAGFDTSGSPPPSTPRPLSVVSYQVGVSPTNPNSGQQLNYGALQVSWTGSATSSATPLIASALQPQSNGSSIQTQFLTAGTLPLPTVYTTVAPEVIRFEYCFLLKTDPAGNSPGKLLVANAPVATAAQQVLGVAPITNIAGIYIGIVVVDPRTRLLFPAGADVNLAKEFPDAVDNQDLLSLWTPLLTPATMTAASLPVKALQGIHLYQRYIPFPQ